MLVVPRRVCCPVPQECGGHIEYQLQRQTVLQNVSGDRLRDAAGPVRAERLRDGHAAQDRSPPCGTSSSSASARSPTRSSGRATGRSTARCHYTVQRPVTRTVWKDVHLHGLPAGARDALETRSYTVCRPVRETTFKTCVYNVSRPVREMSLQGRAPTRSAGRSRRRS